MDGFDSFDLEPFTIQELDSRNHQERFGPGFQEVFSRLQGATLSGTFFPTFPKSHEENPNHEEFLKQSHYPQIHQGQSQAQTLPEPQSYYVPEVIQAAVPSFLITTPRIQDLCSALGPSKRRSSKKREKKAAAKATSKPIPDTTASEPVLNIFTTRVASNNFDHKDTAHTYDGNHAFDFQPKKIVLRSSVVSTSSEPDEKSLDNLPCYTQHGTIADDRGLGPIHKACAHFASDAKFIGKMISNDPNCPNVPTKLPKNSFHRKRKTQIQEAPTSDFLVDDGQCAIHIALSNDPSVDVIKLLMDSSIVTLSISDCNGRLPLSLALRHFNSTTRNKDMEQILDLLIAANPQAVFTADNRMNTPLHYSCMMSGETKVSRQSTGFSLIYGVSDLSCSCSAQTVPKLIKKLASLNPAAIHQRNFNGSTPLELLQSRGGMVNDELLTFLQELAFEDTDVEEAPDL